MKRKIHRTLGSTLSMGAQYFYDPEKDDYINLECPNCRKMIHFGSDHCPECGFELNETMEEVSQARKHHSLDKVMAIASCAFVVIALIWAVIALR